MVQKRNRKPLRFEMEIRYENIEERKSTKRVNLFSLYKYQQQHGLQYFQSLCRTLSLLITQIKCTSML